MDNLIRRSLTGIFIVVFVLGGFWLDPVTFVITGCIIMTGTQYEYYRMIRAAGSEPQMIAGLFFGILLYSLSVLIAAGLLNVKFYLALVPLFFIILVTELYRKGEKPFDSLAQTIFPVIYIVTPFILFPYSAFGHTGLKPLIEQGILVFSPGIVVGFFILLWVNDSGAYLAGVSLGKHRLMERISPKKSWEGFAGGFVLTLVAAWFLASWLGITDRKGWLITGAIISIAGTYGDLAESMLKRSTGFKDSGSIMPGHGGFLDRFDSTIVSFPLVFLYMTLFG